MPETEHDKHIFVNNFKVEIESAAGTSEVDGSWKAVRGGGLRFNENQGVTTGSGRFHTNAPGHKSVEEITLRGAMTDKRAALCTWINETAAGKPWKRNVSITPVFEDGTIGDTVTYLDCRITGYTPPRLVSFDPANPCAPEPWEEEVRFVYQDWTIRA